MSRGSRGTLFDVFILTGGGHLHRLNGPQRINDVPDHDLWRRGPSRNANKLDVMQPLRFYFATVGDQVGRNAGANTDFAQPIRIRADLFAPTTKITSASLVSSNRAVWRFCVA